MGWKHLPNNMKAAYIAAVAGVLMLISGVTGATQWQHTFAALLEYLGSSIWLRILGLIFIAVGSVGGVFVLLGAYGFRNNRVRTARFVIWLGTGFTLMSLLLFLAWQARQGTFPFAGPSLLGFIGILLTFVARFKAKPVPHPHHHQRITPEMLNAPTVIRRTGKL